jgi:hypothetical protein
MTGTEQLGLFDAAKGEVAKEEAITRVEVNASRRWLDEAWWAVLTARQNTTLRFLSTVTSDDVWEVLLAVGTPAPHEPRAMSAVMRRAVREGLLRPTSTFRPSAMPQNHRRPVRVYEVCRG